MRETNEDDVDDELTQSLSMLLTDAYQGEDDDGVDVFVADAADEAQTLARDWHRLSARTRIRSRARGVDRATRNRLQANVSSRRPLRASRARSRRRATARSSRGPPRRADDPPEPPLARFGPLRALVDGYLWPSPVWARIARELERERPR